MHSIQGRTALAALLAPLLLLVACTQAPLASRSPGEPTATAQPQPSAAAARHGHLGRNGSVAWLTSSQGLSLSPDAGRTFAAVPLPAGVSPGAIAAVDAVPATLWLAASGPGRSVSVYARDAAAARWSAGARLTPTWPANLGNAQTDAPSSVWIEPGAAHQVLVVTQLGLSHSVSIPRLFVSGDGAATFAQRVLPTASNLNTQWDAVAMTGSDLVAVVGERIDTVVYSRDGGSTWSPSALQGVAPGAVFVAGTPVFSGATVYLPVAESQSDGSGAFVLLRSTDGGASFGPGGAQTLAMGTLAVDAPPPVASVGTAWWLVSPMTGSVYRSTDDGLTWSRAPASLPQGVGDIAAIDAQNATVTVVEDACAADKTTCSSGQASETTTDGGRTWTAVSP